MVSKEKLKWQMVKAVLRYLQPSPHKNVELYPHHLLFTLYPFRQEEKLKCTVKGSCFAKFYVSAVLNIINRNNLVMESHSDMVEQALLDLHKKMMMFK